MVKKLTKAQGRKRLDEIRSKAFRLYGNRYISAKDYENISKIVTMRTNQLK